MTTKAKHRSIYRMPTIFGPATGPRRGPDGRGFECRDTPKSTSVSVSFRSNTEQLSALLPERFELNGDPIVTVMATYMKEIEWLAGRGYNTLGVTFPATYRGKEETVHGSFLAVLWENLTDPIITGREELGYAKIYCSLPELRIDDSSACCTADWLGFEFLEMNIENLKKQQIPDPTTLSPVDGTLHHKYMPRTGDWGDSDASYPVITPAHTPNRRITGLWSGNGSLSWKRARWEDMPTQYNIINGLADLEVCEILSGTVTKTIGGKDLSDQRILK